MRQNRTKKAIADAYLKLLGDYTIDRITVRMITDTVGCSRKTFYYYFADVYALTRYVCELRMQMLMGDSDSIDTLRSGFLALAQHLQSERQMFLNMYHGYGKEELERVSWEINYHYVSQTITRYVIGRSVSPEDLDAAIHMYADLLFGVLVDWVNNNMTSDYNRVLDIALGSLPHVLDELAGKRL